MTRPRHRAASAGLLAGWWWWAWCAGWAMVLTGCALGGVVRLGPVRFAHAGVWLSVGALGTAAVMAVVDWLTGRPGQTAAMAGKPKPIDNPQRNKPTPRPDRKATNRRTRAEVEHSRWQLKQDRNRGQSKQP